LNKMSEEDTRFKKAVKFIQNLPQDGPEQPTQQQKLDFYALFKQATEGRNTAKKPSMINLVGKAKWEAWNKVGQMTKQEAKKKYVQKVLDVAKKIPGEASQTFQKEIEGTASKL